MAAPSGLGLMALNDTKAGMEGLDKEAISRVIEEASRGSKFYAKKQADQAKLQAQVEELQAALAALPAGELAIARQAADSVVAELRRGRRLDRTIVHVDMDMFFAAVEMREDPSLAERPMAVGGLGMLSTSNYRARRFGVRAAMPGFIAKRLCPELTIVPPNMAKYAEVAEVVRAVFREYDPEFSPMSLDEAYLDISVLVEVSNMEDKAAAAAEIVAEMRAKIQERTGLTASAGIACNCRLAKVASDLNKPDGQFQVAADEAAILAFVAELSIRKVGGIGSVSEQLLNSIGVKTCGDIYRKRAEIKLLFSELSFEFYMSVSQGLGATALEAPEERERKSMSCETTFRDTSDREALLATCRDLCRDLAKDLADKGIVGSAVTVKIKSHDFKLKTKVSQLCSASASELAIFESARRTLVQLLDASAEQPLALRLMGVRMSELRDRAELRGARQTSLLSFMGAKEGEKEAKFTCPVCGKACSSLGDLNTHIDTCAVGGDNLAKEGDFDTVNEQSLVVSKAAAAEVCETVSKDSVSCGRTLDAGEGSEGTGDIKLKSVVEKKPSFFASFLEDPSFGCANPITHGAKDIPVLNSLEVCVPADKEYQEGECHGQGAPGGGEEGGGVTEPEGTKLTCPVCLDAVAGSEVEVGRHVEDCLSRQEVRSILEQARQAERAGQQVRAGKRKGRGEEGGRQAKVARVAGVATIDAFFTRN